MVRKLKNLINDLIVNIILDYLEKTAHDVFSITTNIQGSALLKHRNSMVEEVL